jgi:hypothetical protein
LSTSVDRLVGHLEELRGREQVGAGREADDAGDRLGARDGLGRVGGGGERQLHGRGLLAGHHLGARRRLLAGAIEGGLVVEVEAFALGDRLGVDVLVDDLRLGLRRTRRLERRGVGLATALRRDALGLLELVDDLDGLRLRLALLRRLGLLLVGALRRGCGDDDLREVLRGARELAILARLGRRGGDLLRRRDGRWGLVGGGLLALTLRPGRSRLGLLLLFIFFSVFLFVLVPLVLVDLGLAAASAQAVDDAEQAAPQVRGEGDGAASDGAGGRDEVRDRQRRRGEQADAEQSDRDEVRAGGVEQAEADLPEQLAGEAAGGEAVGAVFGEGDVQQHAAGDGGSREAEALAGADLHRLAEQGFDAEAEHAEHQQVRAHAEGGIERAGHEATDGAHEVAGAELVGAQTADHQHADRQQRDAEELAPGARQTWQWFARSRAARGL